MGERPLPMKETRLKRAEEVIRQRVSNLLLHEIKDPRLGFVTVTRVEASRDFKYAKVFVSVFGDDKAKSEGMKVIARSKRFLQSSVAGVLNTRITPELSFALDETTEKLMRMESLIKEARASDPGLVDDAPPEALAGGEGLDEDEEADSEDEQ